MNARPSVLARAATLLALGATLVAVPPAGAKPSTAGFCAKAIAKTKVDGHHYAQGYRSGGVRFYRDRRFTNEFLACSDTTHAIAEGENLGNDGHFTVKRFVGNRGRCAIAVLENAKAHVYAGAPVKNTIIAAFRLSSPRGSDYNVTATPGSGSFDVPLVRFTSTCYAGWVDVPPIAGGDKVLSVLDIGDGKRFADPNVGAFSSSTDGMTDPKAWTLAPAGRGATLTWTDAQGVNVRQIPAP